MDEIEYLQYLDEIDRLDRRIVDDKSPYDILEQLRTEDGFRVPGCYHIKPAPTYG